MRPTLKILAIARGVIGGLLLVAGLIPCGAVIIKGEAFR